MEYSNIQLEDLPDELLMIIFEKLNNVTLLYYVTGVNKRFNNIIQASHFTSYLTLLRFSVDHSIHSLKKSVVDRFCLEILPAIHHKITWLNLELKSLERILLSTSYPSLRGLGLYSNHVEEVICLLTNSHALNQTIKSQISSLVIDIRQCIEQNSSKYQDLNRTLFTHIIDMFPNLQCLNFDPSSIWHQRISWRTLSPTMISSSLRSLYVCIHDFIDCLYLLDGRFNQLHTLHVNIRHILFTSLTIDNKKKLPNLVSFSMHSDTRTHAYDELIIPLLKRMLNLEKLDLQLRLDSNDEFIDGNYLKEMIIKHMPNLNKFTFNICLFNHLSNKMDLISNEKFQCTFKNILENHQIISYVNHFPTNNYSYFHFYTYPYRLQYYEHITNHFQGGLFKYVHTVSLHDEHPFEHEFFLRIAKSFPFMTNFTLINQKTQQNKLKNNNQDLPIIKYQRLSVLNLIEAHDDYVKQFLVDTKSYLPDYVYLYAKYEVLQRITRNFTYDATRLNCSKITYVFCEGVPNSYPKHLKKYFFDVDMHV